MMKRILVVLVLCIFCLSDVACRQNNGEVVETTKENVEKIIESSEKVIETTKAVKKVEAEEQRELVEIANNYDVDNRFYNRTAYYDVEEHNKFESIIQECEANNEIYYANYLRELLAKENNVNGYVEKYEYNSDFDVNKVEADYEDEFKRTNASTADLSKRFFERGICCIYRDDFDNDSINELLIVKVCNKDDILNTQYKITDAYNNIYWGYSDGYDFLLFQIIDYSFENNIINESNMIKTILGYTSVGSFDYDIAIRTYAGYKNIYFQLIEDAQNGVGTQAKAIASLFYNGELNVRSNYIDVHSDGENFETDRQVRHQMRQFEEVEGLIYNKKYQWYEFTRFDLFSLPIFTKIYTIKRHLYSPDIVLNSKYVNEQKDGYAYNYDMIKIFEVNNEEFKKIDTMKTASEYGLQSTINAMDTIKFGKCPQGSDGSEIPIEWILLERKGCEATFISKYIIDNYVFSNEKLYSNEYAGKWGNSDLYEYLNRTCCNKWFSKNEQEYIYSAIGLLDERMCRTYFGEEDEHGFNYRLASRVTDYLKARADELDITITDKDNWYRGNSSYWTESIVDDEHVMYVGYFGKLNTKGDDPKGNDGVRPVITIRYK